MPRMSSPRWSREIPLDRRTVERDVPEMPGVYEILQGDPYPRYIGSTRVLRIGKSECNLRLEVVNHFARHTVANRLARIRGREGLHLVVIFATVPVASAAATTEAELLREFEDQHWDLPVLNAQRAYGRNADGKYRG